MTPVQLASHEAQLIWSRYNAMVVAHAILIGFLGQAALSAVKPNSFIIIYVTGLGFLLTMIWWRITSVAWSLSHAWLNIHAAPEDTASKEILRVYQEWRLKFLFPRLQDSIWWCAHGVIAVFGFGYMLLFQHFADLFALKQNQIYSVFGVAGLLFVVLLISSLSTHKIGANGSQDVPGP